MNTVKIGHQEWSTRNLCATHFRNGDLDLYSFSGDANIIFEEKKINAYFSPESFGPVVEKIILIQTNESDASIDATKTGFEEKFVIDLKYALELITKDVSY